MSQQADRQRFAYIIHTTRLHTPVGNSTHVARVSSMIDRKWQKTIAVDQFGEIFGTSALDASRNMRELVDDWILDKSALD